MSDKAERMSELSAFPTASKSSGSLKNALDSTDMMAGSSLGSSETFPGIERTAAMESTGIVLSNGQTAGEHMPVTGLWSDMAAMQLSSSDMMAFSAASMPTYAPIMVCFFV